MKVGSIVVIKKGACSPEFVRYAEESYKTKLNWIPKDDEETTYLIRETRKKTVLFDENILGFSACGKEIGIGYEYVIEVLPPDENFVSELEKVIDRFEFNKFY